MSIPRKARIDLSAPAELAIREAIEKVEALGADDLLTDAVISLSDALGYVSAYVDKHVLPTEVSHDPTH